MRAPKKATQDDREGIERDDGRGNHVDMCKRGMAAYLLELLDGTLVDTTALVDQVTGGGRLAGIDVADNDDVDVSLLLLTVRLSASCFLREPVFRRR